MSRQQNTQNTQSVKTFNQTLNVLLFVFSFPLFGVINSRDLQITKIDICHNTGSLTNPYVQISIASDQDMAEHQSHPTDIIPAPPNGCPGEIPTPTPTIIDETEIPQITITPEISETPSITITFEVSETPKSTGTPTFENTLTPTFTETSVPTHTPELQETRKPPKTRTPTTFPFPSLTRTPTPSETATLTATGTHTVTNTPTPSKTTTPTHISESINTPKTLESPTLVAAKPPETKQEEDIFSQIIHWLNSEPLLAFLVIYLPISVFGSLLAINIIAEITRKLISRRRN